MFILLIYFQSKKIEIYNSYFVLGMILITFLNTKLLFLHNINKSVTINSETK